MKVAKEILLKSAVIGCAYVALLINISDTETTTSPSSNTARIIGILIGFAVVCLYGLIVNKRVLVIYLWFDLCWALYKILCLDLGTYLRIVSKGAMALQSVQLWNDKVKRYLKFFFV